MWPINEEKKKDYFATIMQQLQKDSKNNEIIYPEKENIFNAFKLCEWSNLKVVIIGQEPYHNPNEAHGLAFSVKKGIKIPPSLKNIYKELEQEFNTKAPEHGNLEEWAKQGVLLLNSSLTVVKNKPGSHSTIGWHIFTKNIIEYISNNKENIIFLLWGKHAQSFEYIIDKDKHYILKSAHPSPFSANRGFFGNNHFKKTNNILESINKTTINWV